ncbi:MAG: phospholipase [Elusimicrobia bacterium HGW-Elusimicrobia-3]|jgi:phospholipase A1|nr:MAG: phospholipase [Elusimicrobia bacterium HGW-Elusimicrobia-3]
MTAQKLKHGKAAGKVYIFMAAVLVSLATAAPILAQAPSEASESSPIEARIARESGAKRSSFALLAHKPSYLLPATYTSSPNNPAYSYFPAIGDKLDNMEAKFQISFKIPLWEGLFGGKADLYGAYTQLALWQAYNARISAPFREINYEPETFLAYRTDIIFHGARLNYFTIGFNHQSNGQIEPRSRSWNRVVTSAVIQKGKNHLIVRQWTRMPERAKTDDNPGIERYLGYGDILFLRSGRNMSFSVLLRNNLRTGDNKGALQADWRFPLHRNLKGYVQYFTGYGETLIGYNRSSSRVGLGMALTDWI